MAKNDSTETVTRVRKSPAEKATAALAAAQKRYDKAVARQTKVVQGTIAADNEVLQAERFLNFAQGDPSLPQGDAVQAEQELFSA